METVMPVLAGYRASESTFDNVVLAQSLLRGNLLEVRGLWISMPLQYQADSAGAIEPKGCPVNRTALAILYRGTGVSQT